MTEYILSAACPHCGEIADHVEETESPVALDREIPITTRWCPECGDQVGIGQWDLHEEHEIARVTPSQELPRFRTDKGTTASSSTTPPFSCSMRVASGWQLTTPATWMATWPLKSRETPKAWSNRTGSKRHYTSLRSNDAIYASGK